MLLNVKLRYVDQMGRQEYDMLVDHVDADHAAELAIKTAIAEGKPTNVTVRQIDPATMEQREEYEAAAFAKLKARKEAAEKEAKVRVDALVDQEIARRTETPTVDIEAMQPPENPKARKTAK